MSAALSLQGVSRRYELGANNFVEALRGVDLEVEQGEMVAIMGPSGSGKSTLMHIAGGLDQPDGGEVWLEGVRIDDLRDGPLAEIRSDKVGFVFQGFNLLHTLSAEENVALAAEYHGLSRRKAIRTARELLELLGLEERLSHRPSELSGGEQQRVAIARALVNRPCVLMGDEPTGNLDTKNSAEIMRMLRLVNEEQRTTIVLVTHDPSVAEQCRRRVHMCDGLIEAESA
jgi:putative ABC transport system ATP-binding protein